MSKGKDNHCYCGPFWVPNFLRPKFYNEECSWHDALYTQGKWTRKKCDDYFLFTMLRVAPNRLKKIEAYFLYYTVRLFGWLYYGKP